MGEVAITKKLWISGNNLVVTIPKEIKELLELKVGDMLGLKIRKVE